MSRSRTVALEIVAWDKPRAGTPMLATMKPQEAIIRGLLRPAPAHGPEVLRWMLIKPHFTRRAGTGG
jgi:hypothetical protein